jgi:hypothetical protein
MTRYDVVENVELNPHLPKGLGAAVGLVELLRAHLDQSLEAHEQVAAGLHTGSDLGEGFREELHEAIAQPARGGVGQCW